MEVASLVKMFISLPIIQLTNPGNGFVRIIAQDYYVATCQIISAQQLTHVFRQLE